MAKKKVSVRLDPKLLEKAMEKCKDNPSMTIEEALRKLVGR